MQKLERVSGVYGGERTGLEHKKSTDKRQEWQDKLSIPVSRERNNIQINILHTQS